VLFWCGRVGSHWVAPATLFAALGPAIGVLASDQTPPNVAVYLLANACLFYTAFAVGRLIFDLRRKETLSIANVE
jgi:hypothetical protein